MRKSVENLLVSSHDVVSSSISSLSQSLPFAAMTLPGSPAHSANSLDPRSPSPSGSPQASPRPSPRLTHRRERSEASNASTTTTAAATTTASNNSSSSSGSGGGGGGGVIGGGSVGGGVGGGDNVVGGVGSLVGGGSLGGGGSGGSGSGSGSGSSVGGGSVGGGSAGGDVRDSKGSTGCLLESRPDNLEDSVSRSSDSSQVAESGGGGGGGGSGSGGGGGSGGSGGSGGRSGSAASGSDGAGAGPAAAAAAGASGTATPALPVRERKESTHRVPGVDRKKKTSWYSALYPTYKSRSEDFKRLFKEVPPDERLIVDYSCALQKDILVHGRLYVSQNYLCFYANIFRWETQVTIQWKDVTSITKEKTALVIPNAVLICTESEKHFLTSFTARDKTYLMLFRVWQNALLDQQMSMQEMWQWVHTCYGDELGLTSDDEDYVPPTVDDEKPGLLSVRYSVDSFSEASISLECFSVTESQMEGLDSPEGGGLETLPGSPGEGNASTPATPPSSLVNGGLPDPQPPAPVRAPSSELLPTDMSDTTESDVEKSGVKLEMATCTSTHEGRRMLRISLPIHVDELFTLLFTSSQFMVDFHNLRRTTDIVLAPWQQNPDTQLKQRILTMTVAVSASVGPKSTQVCENQTMLPCSKPGQLYAIDVESSNAGIPYADSFYVTMHYCLARAGERESSLSVFCSVKYRKSVWGLVRSFIEKNTWSGLEDFYGELGKALRVECERLLPPKKKHRRPGVRPQAPLLPDAAGGRRPAPRLRLLAGRAAGAAGSLRGVGGGGVGSAGGGGVAGSGALGALGGGGGGGAAAAGGGGAAEPIGYILLAVLIVLAGLNGVLYYKLWLLEEAASAAAAGTTSLGLSGAAELEAAQRFLLLQRATAAAAAAAAAATAGAGPDAEGDGGGGGAGAGGADGRQGPGVGPRSPDDWLRLLQHQEALHNAELARWQRVLHAAVRLLRQTEDSLSELQLSIAPLGSQQVLATLKAAAAQAAARQAAQAAQAAATSPPPPLAPGPTEQQQPPSAPTPAAAARTDL